MKHNLAKYLGVDDLLLVGALVIALALVWNTVTAMQRNYRLQQKFDQLQAEVDLQQIENQNLKYKIAYLKTDDYLELEARDKFSKSAPGETLVYLPDSGSAAQAPVAKTTVQAQKIESKGWRANVEAWWHFLQGKNKPRAI